MVPNMMVHTAIDEADRIQRSLPPHEGTLLFMFMKASTLNEIRQTVSFLTETPDYDSFQIDTSGSEEEPEAQKRNDGFVAPTYPRLTQGRVVHRLVPLCYASSNLPSHLQVAVLLSTRGIHCSDWIPTASAPSKDYD